MFTSGDPMKVYVATSWKNKHQPYVVEAVREAGHTVYDFRHPEGEDSDGFHWSEINGGWQTWSAEDYRLALLHPAADRGFTLDMDALRWCDACLLVLPCGRSAHLEIGWAIGAGKRTVIYLAEFDTPELMYKAADKIVTTLEDAVAALKRCSP